MKRHRYPKPEPPKDGMFLMDPDTGKEAFITWEELNQACREIMGAPEYETGKPNYKNDPTYNLARNK